MDDARSQAVLIRLPDGTEGTVSGYIVYSRVCTHAGCPVALYRASAKQLMCPVPPIGVRCRRRRRGRLRSRRPAASATADSCRRRRQHRGDRRFSGARRARILEYGPWLNGSSRGSTSVCTPRRRFEKRMRKAFPDHWSFMLGEINMYAFLVLVLTGTFLALFFDPSAATTIYRGPYTLLDGTSVSGAFASDPRA